MKSIKAKIIAGIIICTLLSSASIGFLSIKDIYQTSDQGAEKEMTLTCLNGQSEINAQIAQIAQSVDTLSSIAMERLDFSKFKGNNTYVMWLNLEKTPMVQFAFMYGIILISQPLHQGFF